VDLSLYDNGFSGPIPPGFGQLSKMESLYLDVNHFSGTIPTELALIKRLDDLRLRHNNLAGTIPSELGSLEGLQILYLDRNQLTGSVPTEFGHLKYLIELHLYGNQLNGPIPTELANLHALCKYNRQCDDPSLARQHLCFSFGLPISALITASLYLDNNKLTGGIPSEFGTMIDLGKPISNMTHGVIRVSSCTHRLSFFLTIQNNSTCTRTT
jgi:Leucine-rich repeat (LRR) protein